ncbi:hypothetical protein NCCP133_15890 [Cytobacillus sp. NCCP-133]|nr:hypothetical protein NCCP133_15890 [Cytobacillus sp. NCCP-133]
MRQRLLRVGTAYIPVTDVNNSLAWYLEKLGVLKAIKMTRGKWLLSIWQAKVSLWLSVQKIKA